MTNTTSARPLRRSPLTSVLLFLAGLVFAAAVVGLAVLASALTSVPFPLIAALAVLLVVGVALAVPSRVVDAFLS